MSTRCSIKYGDKFHLYNECLDNENVYLEIEMDEDAEVHGKHVTIKIPAEIWEVLREHSQMKNYDLVDKTDEQIYKDVLVEVEERIERYKNAPEKQKGLYSMFGCIPFGSAEDPAEDQIMRGLEYYHNLKTRQCEIVKKYEEILSKQRP